MKEKIIAALLAFFLGTLGVHWFYLDEQAKGKKYLIWAIVGICLSWAFIGLIPLLVLAILAFIDFIKIILMSDDEFNEKYNKKKEVTQ